MALACEVLNEEFSKEIEMRLSSPLTVVKPTALYWTGKKSVA